jgi:hypothetical protein
MAPGTYVKVSWSEQDFRELKARGYKPGWYPDAVHTDSGAALWLDANGGLARWQQVGCGHVQMLARLYRPVWLPLGCASHPVCLASEHDMQMQEYSLNNYRVLS